MAGNHPPVSLGPILNNTKTSLDRLLRARPEVPLAQSETSNGVPMTVYKTDHGRMHVFNKKTGEFESRFSERASFSWGGLGSSFTVGAESGPWPLMAGYIGEIWSVALAARVAGTAATTLEFHFNGASFHTTTLASGSTLQVDTVAKPTTGAMTDYITVKLTAVAADLQDLTAYARML